MSAAVDLKALAEYVEAVGSDPDRTARLLRGLHLMQLVARASTLADVATNLQLLAASYDLQFPPPLKSLVDYCKST